MRLGSLKHGTSLGTRRSGPGRAYLTAIVARHTVRVAGTEQDTFPRVDATLILRARGNRVDVLTARGWRRYSLFVSKRLQKRAGNDARSKSDVENLIRRAGNHHKSAAAAQRCWYPLWLTQVLWPPLRRGAPRRLATPAKQLALEAFLKDLKTCRVSTADQARLGYDHSVLRRTSIERRAEIYLVGVGAVLAAALAVGGDSSKALGSVGTASRTLILVALVTLAVMLVYALAATMVTFDVPNANAASRVVTRAGLDEDESRRDLVAWYLVGQHRVQAVATWKLAMLKRATGSFAVAGFALIGALVADIYS